MYCPNCGGKLRVLDNVKNPDENEIYRKKSCTACGHVFHTVEYEVVENQKFKDEWNKYYRQPIKN